MSDVCDDSDKKIEDAIAEGVRVNAKAVEAIPAGNPGDCEWCGEWFGRLVGGACGFCRDKYKLG